MDIFQIKKEIHTKLDSKEYEQKTSKFDETLSNVEQAVLMLKIELNGASSAFN
jgi:hypothetical protein